MPLKLMAPIIETFVLEETDKLFENAGEPTTVTIRQATQMQHEKRQSIFATMEQTMPVNSEEAPLMRHRFVAAELARMETYLTLVDCNIENESGKPLFKFRKDDKGLEMTTSEFKEAFGQLPLIVANEIHSKVLEVNDGWKPNLGEAS